MEFNTKLSKLIARRKVIETRKRLNKIVQSPFEINNTLKTVYQNNIVDNNKKYIITRQDYCRNFVTINIDFISNMKYFDKGANTILIVYMIKLKLTLLLILYFIMIVKIKLKFQYRL